MNKLILSLFFVIVLAGSVSAGEVIINFPIADGEYNYSVNSMGWNYNGVLTQDSLCWYNLESTYTPFNCSVTPLTSLVPAEGYNNWTIKVQENKSISTTLTKSITFFVDSIIPDINVLTPDVDIYYTNQNYIFVNLTVTKEGVLLNDNNLSIFEWKVYQDGDLKGFLTLLGQPDEYSFRYPPSTPGSDGDYNYVINLKDKINGHSIYHTNSINMPFIFDTVVPSVSVTNPLNEADLIGTVSINGNADDDRAGVQNITLFLDDAKLTVCEDISCSYDWDSKNVSDGVHNISAIAYDKAGNSNEDRISVDVDNTPPEIDFNSPLNGIYNTNQMIDINASDVHLEKIELYVNGIIVSETTESYINYELTEGNYTVYGIAYDSFGNTKTSEVRNILVDVTKPEVNVGEDKITNANILIDAITSDNLAGIDSYSWSKISGSGNVNFSSSNAEDTTVDMDSDGSYILQLIVVDKAGNTNSDDLTVMWDITPPVITLSGDNPQTIEVFDSYTELEATALDNLAGDLTGEIIIDISNVNTDVLGTYNVLYDVSDLAGNSDQETRVVNVVDTVSPVITLLDNNPQTVEIGTSYVESGATADDNYDGDITTNIVTDSSAVDINTVGDYSVTYTVADGSGNTATKTRTVHVVDTTESVVTSISPIDKPYTSSATINLIYNVTDHSNVADCSLILNGAVDQTDDTITKNIDQQFSLSGKPSGKYSWSISCKDIYDNEGSSTVRSFTVLSDLSFTETNYTNLSLENNISNAQFFVENVDGIINWTKLLDLSSGKDWASYIVLSYNHAEVNAPELNGNAKITLYNLSWSNPRILKNNNPCSDCNKISYVNGTLIFTVTGFSTYTTDETPIVVSSGGGSSGNSGRYNNPILTYNTTSKPVEEKNETTPITTLIVNEEEKGMEGITGAVTGPIESKTSYKKILIILSIAMVSILLISYIFFKRRS